MATDPNISIPIPPTLTKMVEGASIAMGKAGSLFQNPAKQAFESLANSTKGINTFGGVMKIADPSFDPTKAIGSITTTSTGITDSLTAKVSAMSTELPLTISAQSLQDRAQSVDAIIAKNLAGIPDQISKAFPTVPVGKSETSCPANHVEAAMAPITQSNGMVNAGNDKVAEGFNNTGAMAPVYAALNAIPGVAVSTGKELLAFLGNVPAALQGAVNTILTTLITPGSALLTQLKGSFSSTETAMGQLSTSFTKVVDDAAASVTKSLNFLTGSNTVTMLGNTDPCVANVMNKVIDPAMVNPPALALSNGVKDKSINLPGTQSVEATNDTKPVDLGSQALVAKVSAEAVIAPLPGRPVIVEYDLNKLTEFLNKVSDQQKLANQDGKKAADVYKTTLEDWMPTVDFQKKKLAAGASKANTVGTSTDPVALAEWKEVYDAWLPRVESYNTTAKDPADKSRILWQQMTSENLSRNKYGKFPYTYQISQGVNIPEDKQYTNLDTTK